jgi:hypothetical protein
LVSLLALMRQRAKSNTLRERRVSDARIAALAREIKQRQEQQANLTYQNLSCSPDELGFELSKGLV